MHDVAGRKTRLAPWLSCNPEFSNATLLEICETATLKTARKRISLWDGFDRIILRARVKRSTREGDWCGAGLERL